MKSVVGLLLGSMVAISPGYASDKASNGGDVNFSGYINDVSCTISINGQGRNANVDLSPITLMDIQIHGAGAYISPKPFSIRLSDCQLTDGGILHPEQLSVHWVGGNLLQNANGESMGYLANLWDHGAKNIYMALAVNNDSILTIDNKIIPSDAGQNLVDGIPDGNNGALFVYYIGYVTQAPEQVVTGPITTYATYEVEYQ